jgi:hypothetical protein
MFIIVNSSQACITIGWRLFQALRPGPVPEIGQTLAWPWRPPERCPPVPPSRYRSVAAAPPSRSRFAACIAHRRTPFTHRPGAARLLVSEEIDMVEEGRA